MFYFTRIRPLEPQHQERIGEFFARVADGIGLGANDPAYRLRQRFLQGIGISRAESRALVLKALYAHIDQKPMGQLRWSEGEGFPELRGFRKELPKPGRIDPLKAATV